MFHVIDADRDKVELAVDEFGDSYCRDITASDLKQIFEDMPLTSDINLDATGLLNQFQDHHIDFGDPPGWLFRGVVAYFDGGDVEMSSGHESHEDEFEFMRQQIRFGRGEIVNGLEEGVVTHVIVGKDRSRLRAIREMVAAWKKLPRIVTSEWVEETWREKTVLDEEREFDAPFSNGLTVC